MAWPTTSRHERGYGAAWDRLRRRILRRDLYMCQCPECKGLGKTATEVDHIVPKGEGGTDDPTNLRAVNADCHKRITILQMGKTPRPRVIIGLDGFPVD